jgi:hypothetical protein
MGLHRFYFLYSLEIIGVIDKFIHGCFSRLVRTPRAGSGGWLWGGMFIPDKVAASKLEILKQPLLTKLFAEHDKKKTECSRFFGTFGLTQKTDRALCHEQGAAADCQALCVLPDLR